MSRTLGRAGSCLSVAVGLPLCLVAVLAAFGSVSALIERSHGGRGIMFADAEFLGLVALLCGATGAAALVIGAKLAKH